MKQESIVNKVRKRNVNLANKLIKIGKSLSLESDIKKIFKIIINEVLEFTKADRGIIYITSTDQRELNYEIVRTVSQNTEWDDVAAKEKLESVSLFVNKDEPIMKSLATFVYHTGFEAHFDDVYAQDYFNIDLTKEMDKKTFYHSKSMIAIPLVDHEETVLGIIELTNSIDEDGNIVAFNEEHIEVLLSVASQAAITLSNKLLVNNLEKMIFDFTQAIAYAIDLKSDDAYKHVQHVAQLTNMMANEINTVNYGSYAGTQFSKNELDEIALSGWLHDLGKIVTSDVLLKKDKKLIKTYDRIGVLELKLDLISQVIENKLMLKIGDEEFLQSVKDKLPEYRDFLLEMNEGKEFLDADKVDIIYEIASVEIEHNGKYYRLLDADEMENLLIKRGTLTDSEYEEIQQHAQLTYDILKNIKFPAKYQNVPRIASMHHERLNGKGYPLGLNEDEIPVQSRILAIADVFDALMSKRSYKKGYGIERSLVILANMAKDGELDSSLLDIVIQNGIYKDFAKMYNDNSVNDINVEKIRSIYRS